MTPSGLLQCRRCPRGLVAARPAKLTQGVLRGQESVQFEALLTSLGIGDATLAFSVALPNEGGLSPCPRLVDSADAEPQPSLVSNKIDVQLSRLVGHPLPRKIAQGPSVT